MYIYCNPQTDCFIVSQLFSVARHIGHLMQGSKPAQLYVRLSIILLSQLANHVMGIIRHYVVDSIYLHFCLPNQLDKVKCKHLSGIWTLITDSISYDDDHYTKCASDKPNWNFGWSCLFSFSTYLLKDDQ